jgi:hypothetical protein
MNATIRLPRGLFRAVHEDLERPHAHAFERVAFVFARFAHEPRGILLTAFDYCAVADRDYIEDATVGARINGRAIRSAMQHALTNRDGVLHVHAHPHSGTPGFSSVDMRGLKSLIPSFYGVAPNAAHGGLVFSHDRVAGRIWLPGKQDPIAAKVTLVGYPMTISGGFREGPL